MKIKKIIINLMFLIAAFVIQSSIFPLIPVLAASPNLLLILTFSFGFIGGKESGMFYGLVAGLFMDLFYSSPIGFYTLLFIFIGYLNGICTQYYYEEYITLPLVLSVINEIAYGLYVYVFRFLFRGKIHFGYYFMKIMVPEIIFTVVTTLLVYRLILWYSRRLQEMEKRRDTPIV